MSPQMVVPRRPVATPRPFAGNAPSPGPFPQAAADSGRGTLSFWICAAYTFLIFSRTVEFIDSSGRLHLSLVSGLLCLVAVVVTGGIPKMLISRPGWWLSLFCFWIFIGLPFSTWKGGSVSTFQSVWIKSYLTFFIVGGLIFTLKQLRTMTVIFALATISQIYLAFHASSSSNQEDDRLAVTYGSLGNANDLASALLIGAPFIVFAMTDKKINPFFRMLCLPLLGVLLVAVLKTGSRGGLVAIVVLIMVGFFRSSAGGKMKIMLAGICLLALFAAVVPSELRTRYMTIFKTDRTATTSHGAESALDSSNARKELFRNAFILTYRHPIFGVGLGQFSVQSFNLCVERGLTGMWFTCHDIFGLVSAEIGIPGLIFFCGCLISCLRLLSRISKLAPATPELEELSRLGNTLLMSMVAFLACGIFNTQAYSYQLPVLAGLAAALDRFGAPYLASAPSSQLARTPPAFVNRHLAGRTIPAMS
jgi:O-antigen ligase